MCIVSTLFNTEFSTELLQNLEQFLLQVKGQVMGFYTKGIVYISWEGKAVVVWVRAVESGGRVKLGEWK